MSRVGAFSHLTIIMSMFLFLQWLAIKPVEHKLYEVKVKLYSLFGLWAISIIPKTSNFPDLLDD